MKTEDKARLGKGAQRIFDQESSRTPRSSRSSSRASSTSTSSSSSCSSSDRSRSPSAYRSRKRHSHGSRYSSSSSSSCRSRSRPRCCRASDHYRCSRRHRSRSSSPYPWRSSRYGRRRCSRSISRSSSRERYYMRSRKSRSRSSSYDRARGSYTGRFRCRFSTSPIRRYYRYRSKSPECSIRLSQTDKINLLNIARENAAKILGVDVVKLPASVRCVEGQVKKSDSEKSVRADPASLKNSSQGKGEADEDFNISRTSPTRKPISFGIINTVAKPSSSPTHHVTESKVTSRADSVGNGMPYGRWIPVRTASTKKR